MLATTMPGLRLTRLNSAAPGAMEPEAAHDGVVRVDAEGREEGVHRAAQAAVEAGLAGEDLAVSAVDQELDGQFPDRAPVAFLERAQNRAVRGRTP